MNLKRALAPPATVYLECDMGPDSVRCPWARVDTWRHRGVVYWSLVKTTAAGSPVESRRGQARSHVHLLRYLEGYRMAAGPPAPMAKRVARPVEAPTPPPAPPRGAFAELVHVARSRPYAILTAAAAAAAPYTIPAGAVVWYLFAGG